MLASFQLVIIGLSVGHHDPQMVHEGDDVQNFDFALYQMRIVYERNHAKSNIFVSLTTFGDHLMHHIFPTLDHALLPQMSEALLETCKEFNIEIRNCSMLGGFLGQIKQLKRTRVIEKMKSVEVV